MIRKLRPIHPGEILKEPLDDLGISMNRLAQALHVPPNRISGIVAGRRGISGETALRLARYFNTTPDYWTTCRPSTISRRSATNGMRRSSPKYTRAA